MTKRQQLPRSGPAREALREKGQFWTPPWAAEAMVAFASAETGVVFDPAFGAGAFALAGEVLSEKQGRKLQFAGCELDRSVLLQARENGVGVRDLRRVHVGDFLGLDTLPKGASVVANPPYIRHHRLGLELKSRLRRIAVENLGRPLDGRTGIHVFFLIHALRLLDDGGRLAFILPSDVCEGVYAADLWKWIGSHFRIDAVVTFDPSATPFPGVDTNPIIVLIQKSRPASKFVWARVKVAGGEHLLEWVQKGMPRCSTRVLHAERRDLEVGLRVGVSRRVQPAAAPEFTLGNFVRVMRGIATGANEYFVLTSKRARELGIPTEFLKRTVGRTRDVPGAELHAADLQELDRLDRATFLFAPDGRPLGEFPKRVQDYLAQGEELGLPRRALIAQRRPWYKMERRQPPPFLFAYLGRRNARFIRNAAQALPLTGFLCVYPHPSGREAQATIRGLLEAPELVAELETVAKSYGAGALKVEPRALERLAVPPELVVRLNLRDVAQQVAQARQGQLQLAL